MIIVALLPYSSAKKNDSPMIIEAVIVSVNYADYLAYTLPLNKGHFNHLVVVTISSDWDTINLCKHYYVKCIIDDSIIENGKLNKGKAINIGINNLHKTGWIVHLDGDIVLPPQTRRFLEKMNLDQNGIYGIDRVMCPNFEEWLKHYSKPQVQHEDDIFIHFGKFPVCARVYKEEFGGYIPIGFFQLFHNSTFLEYPQEHSSCARSDMLFAAKYVREDRYLIPELIGIHLQTRDMRSMGVNWNGRKSRKFGLDDLYYCEELELDEINIDYMDEELNNGGSENNSSV